MDCSSGTSKRDARLQIELEDNGLHECEVLDGKFESEQEECEAKWKRCTKNPGHHDFFPESKFSLRDLPVWCRKQPVLETIRKISALTVKIRVGFTSWDRPDGYCFSSLRGKHIGRLGTGFVYWFERKSGPCPCPICETSIPCHTWYKVIVNTAHHVVYNSEEAKSTEVHVFYDDKASIEDGRMKTLWGSSLENIDNEGDKCDIVCVTHDKSVVEQLKAHRKNLQLRFVGQPTARPISRWRNLCVIVSHPHGQPKQICVGEMKGWEFQSLNRKSFTYSTATCSGSSGALMLLLEFYQIVSGLSWQSGMMWLAPHSKGGVGVEPNQSGWTAVDVEDWFKPISVRLSRSLLWLFGFTWFFEKYF